MPAPELAEKAVRLAIAASQPHAMLAAEPLARHFGLPLAEAEALLARGHGEVTVAPGQDKGLALFQALGLCITRLEPVPRADLSLRLLPGAEAAPALELLAGAGFAAEGFAGPAGLLLEGLSRPLAETLAERLRPAGVAASLCPTETARFDLFAPRGHRPSPRLLHLLRVLGCAPGGAVPALATGLDRSSTALLLARCPGEGLIAVNQAFERFDLVLTWRGRLSLGELRDFLLTRGQDAGEGLSRLARGQALRIERALPRRLAGQFLSDYAQIGLPARAELLRG